MKSKKLAQLLAKRKKKPADDNTKPKANVFASRAIERPEPELAPLFNAALDHIEPNKQPQRIWLNLRRNVILG